MSQLDELPDGEEGGENSDDTSGKVSNESDKPRKKRKANIAEPKPSIAEMSSSKVPRPRVKKACTLCIRILAI